MGGKLETLYFALGDDDYFIIVDLPDITAAAPSGPGALTRAVRMALSATFWAVTIAAALFASALVLG